MQVFKDAKIVSGGAIRSGCVITENGKIIGVEERFDAPDGAVIIDCEGRYLSSGLVDLHVHGGGGYSAMSDNPDDIIKMSLAHASHGVTSVTPTTLAAQIPILRKAVETVKKASDMSVGVNILGTHLEGPFISPEMRGAQSKDDILPPTPENVDALLGDGSGITMIGAAPELDGSFALAEKARNIGITVSAAHTSCSFETAAEAVRYGFSDVTHLYSACSQMHKEGIFRKVGLVEAALCMDEYTTQFIADLRHIPVGAVKLIYKCKGADGAYPISDGLEFSASDMRDGQKVIQRNGQAAICENGVMLLVDRSCLAGSITSGDMMLANLYKKCGIPLTECIRMMTETPLSVIGRNGNKGLIKPGYDADIIVFDGDINLKYVCARGVEVVDALH